MNIGFEAKRFFTNRTGLGNYSRFIVGALSSHQPQNKYYLYTPRGTSNKDAKEIISRPNINVVMPGSFFKLSKSTSIWRTWGISKEKSTQGLSIFHGLSQELPIGIADHIKKVVTVHDLIYLRYPKFYSRIDAAIYKYKVLHACKKADRIIAISRQTADDLVQFLKVDASKIEVVYQGCHSSFKKKLTPEELAQIKIKYNLPDQYILNVGTVEERKNVMLLLKAMAGLNPSLRIPLVIVGKQTAYYKEVVTAAQRLKVLDMVKFLQGVPFADFPALYQGASVFVYPSLFEGFGIPLVEAIESGIPVITSSGSCFTEAAGPYSIYVNPHSPEELQMQIERVLSDNTLRSDMVSQSTAYIQRFNPEVIADNLSRLYNSL